jgi:hypothetical protein
MHWTMLKEDSYFEGPVPEGYRLCASPSKGYVILDVDRHDGKDGFENIPIKIIDELEQTFHYPTKNNGVHYWLRYSGSKPLGNKTSGQGYDLRTEKGYVCYYMNDDIRDNLHLIKETSPELNKFLETWFSYKD